MRAKRRAKDPEIITVKANQKLEPSRLIDKNKETNDRCIAAYPKAIIRISRDSAFYFKLDPLIGKISA